MRRSKVLIYGITLLGFAAAPYLLSPYDLSLLGRFLALSILALGLSLVWGRGGILSLGQGVFFGLGGYAIAMHLKLVSLAPGDLPDFMVWTGMDHLPGWWGVFRNTKFALVAAIAVPSFAAAGLAWLVFHRRVGGVYFALITQALALAFATLLISQQSYTGGFNGLTDFGALFGFPLADPRTERLLYWLTLALLALVFAALQWVLATDFGKILVAIRDGENRLRFLGYNPAPYKVVVFAIGGACAGVAGALFTMHVGVISPAMVGVVPSIEMVIWVAVGGRSSLFGAVIGTLLVNFGKDRISSALPELWLFVMGLLFVVVVMILPRGLSGVGEHWQRFRVWRWLPKFRRPDPKHKTATPVMDVHGRGEGVRDV